MNITTIFKWAMQCYLTNKRANSRGVATVHPSHESTDLHNCLVTNKLVLCTPYEPCSVDALQSGNRKGMPVEGESRDYSATMMNFTNIYVSLLYNNELICYSLNGYRYINICID